MYAPITHQNTEHFWSPTQKFKIPDLSELKLFQVGTHTVFENPRKIISPFCERSQLRLHFESTKVHQKCQIVVNLASF